jgi:hypothetical protein
LFCSPALLYPLLWGSQPPGSQSQVNLVLTVTPIDTWLQPIRPWVRTTQQRHFQIPDPWKLWRE